MEKIKQAIEILDQIISDPTVPKNIKNAAREAKESLDSQDEIKIKVDRALQYLDAVADDPNMPIYTRTQIWNVMSMLESI